MQQLNVMRIKFLQSVGEVRHSWAKGGEYSLPKSEAEYYIRVGLAEEVKEEDTQQRPLKKLKDVREFEAEKVRTRPVKSKK